MNQKSPSKSQQIIMALRNAREQIEELEQRQREPIAIVGMGCRLPGHADTPEQFWDVLRNGVNGVIEMPPHHHSDHLDAQAAGVVGGFLDRVDQFDPQFFGIAPREAALIDPQQRLLLEVCWEAMESAHVIPQSLFDSEIGVFVGLCQTDYAKIILGQETVAEDDLFHANVGTIMSTAAGRISYTFGFTGPAVVIDTACSSSLLAIHQACQSLRSQECSMALAGGVNLILLTDWASQPNSDSEQQFVYAADGRCKTFDATADGFGRGEGCGMVVLKRLSDAQADGDTIMAVIRGSMVNQDGRSSGLTAPSGPSQQRVIRHALSNAGVEPGEVSYIEAHGTGTMLGDPIEIGSLNAVFGQRSEPLWVGSVKTNVAHLEGAAGVAGLIKIVLSFQHKELPPHLNFQEPNPFIEWEQSPVLVPLQPTEWRSEKRIAGLSSFGISGTNAHIIVEEAPSPESLQDQESLQGKPSDGKLADSTRANSLDHPVYLLTISAKSAAALYAYVQRYQTMLVDLPEAQLGDLCYSSQIGRSHFSHRLSIPVDSVVDLQKKLANYIHQSDTRSNGASPLHGQTYSVGVVPQHTRAPKIAFLFTGQGAQYIDMGRELYKTEPTFRATLDRCDEILQDQLGESLLNILYPGKWASGQVADFDSAQPNSGQVTIDKSDSDLQPANLLSQTQYTQPALFALEVALATLWQSWGIQPNILIGHSVGEIAAACVAGLFSLEDGLKLVAARGQLMGKLPQDGEMVSVMANEARVQTAIGPYAEDVSIAAINGQESIVISGQREAVLAITEQFTDAGTKTRTLTVSHAFHSPLMEPMLEDFRQVAESITYQKPNLRLVSNLTGQLASDDIRTPDYWVRHVREAVRFADGMSTLQKQGIEIFLEIGPKPILLGMIGDKETRHPAEQESPLYSLSVPSLRENQNDWQQILTSLGELHAHGVAVDWEGFHQGNQRNKITLPTYPFQRKRYWIEQTTGYTNGLQPGTQPGAGFANWLSDSSIEQLTELITNNSYFDADERETVGKVLAALETESRSQQLAAQIESMLYEISWERTRMPSMVPPTNPGRWLILADEGGLGKRLATELTGLGETVDLLQIVEAQTTAALLEQFNQASRMNEDTLPFRGVIHLWSLNEGNLTDAPASNMADDELRANVTQLMQSQERNLGSVLQLIQILAKSNTSLRLWIITENAQHIRAHVGEHVNPTERIAITQTPLWGLGRVIALEHGELWGGLIDLDSRAEQPVQAKWLLSEILKASPDNETQLAFRQGARHVARLTQSNINHSASQATVSIHEDGAYLITGGLGGLGLLVAGWLAEEGATQLILTGRRGPSAAQQEAINKLEADGVTVKIAQVDVSDATAMQQLFAQLATDELALKGIFHTAGILDDSILLNQSWERFATVLASKVTGSWLLHQLTRSFDLDLMVFFSSGVSILGNMGQGNYAAANSFMDGLAHYRRQQGLPGFSISWGGWTDVGMAARTSKIRLDESQLITPEVGMAAMAKLLAGASAGSPSSPIHVGVIPVDWGQIGHVSAPFLANFMNNTVQSGSFAPDATISEASLVKEIKTQPASRRLEYTKLYLQEAVASILGMDEDSTLDRKTGFADLGMDSLMALELRRWLEYELDRPLPTTIAFEYPTVDELASYVLDDLLALREAQTATQIVGPRYYRPFEENEPIAVISMACRFPGADTPEDFWHLLSEGIDMVQEVPSSRWDINTFYDPHRPLPGKMYMREAAFMDNVESFDPIFFGIAPREAVSMDPQHRLLLEVSWETLERAGLAPSSLIDSPTGVFIGIGPGDYGAASGGQSMDGMDTHVATSSGHSVAAGRLSYTLGLQGPTMAIDTACSSSLVSIHLACQSLRAGECDLALTGGVKLMLSPFGHVALSQMQALSPDGRCKTFDAAADGYGRGEGCGMVLLKRLSDAQEDGDTIFAVVRGSAVNHDGPSSGLTVPNKRAQEKVLQQALVAAQIAPEEVTYVEAHGTGTPLGDPIEIRALSAVFGAERETPLIVGSVKTNVGHLEEAAGIVGFMKTVLALHHQTLPPHLHFHTPNPYIEWDEFSIDVPTQLQPWPHHGSGSHDEVQPCIAGVSSFGISGTNAHVVVASAPQQDETREQAPELNRSEEGNDNGNESKMATQSMYLLPLSAKNPSALSELALRYREHLQAHPNMDLSALCHTAALGRDHFTHRLAILATDPADLQDKLALVQNNEASPLALTGTASQSRQRIAFLFTGQGSQYVGMGQELYETEPTFRATIDQCDELLQEHLGQSLLGLLYSATSNQQPATSNQQPATSNQLDQTQYTQPALFALEYALAKLWQAWGIQPSILIGHSVGEIVAACVAGIFSLEDGLKLIAARGRLMSNLPQDGEMVSLMAHEERVQEAIDAYYEASEPVEVSIAAVNGPESVVISGRREVVLKIVDQLAAEGIKTRRLVVSHAFHSPLMDPMLEAFHQVAASITYSEPTLPLISNVTGKRAGEEVTTPEYWVRHVREAVRFADGAATLQAEGIDILLEIGPKPTLLGMLGQAESGQTASTADDQVEAATLQSAICNLPSLRENRSDWQQILTSLGELYVQGVEIDWQKFDNGVHHNKIVLPTYPFQRQRYWIDVPKAQRPAEALTPLIDRMSKSPFVKETLFETLMSGDTLPFLTDHIVYDTIVAPGACHLAMVLSAAALSLKEQALRQNGTGESLYQLRDVIFPQALAIQEDENRIAQIIFEPLNDELSNALSNLPSNGSHSSSPHATSIHSDSMGLQTEFRLVTMNADSVEAYVSAEEAAASVHAVGTLDMVHRGAGEGADLSTLKELCSEAIAEEEEQENRDEQLNELPIFFGPTFRWIDELWQPPHQSETEPKESVQILSKLHRPDVVNDLGGYVLHPGLLDACFQTVGLAQQIAQPSGDLHLPFALESFVHYDVIHPNDVSSSDTSPSDPSDVWWCHVAQVEETKWNIHLFDGSGQLITQIHEFELRVAPQSAIQAQKVPTEWLYTLDWEEMPLAANSDASTEIETAEEATNQGQRPDCWLVVGELNGLSQVLTDTLQTEQIPAIASMNGPKSVQELSAQYRSVGVVYLGGSAQEIGPAAVPEKAAQLSGELLHLTQALVESDLVAHLWIVTQGCQTLTAEQHPISTAAGPLWGMGRTIAQEQPQLHCVTIDLDDVVDNADGDLSHLALAATLSEEFVANLENESSDSQVAYREGIRYVAQLNPWQAPAVMDETEPVRLQLTDYGSLDHLDFVPLTRRSPQSGEIEIEVKAVGLNFRDVLNALGMLKEYYADVLGVTDAKDVGLGFECAGVVTAVGNDVTEVAVGDRVMGLGPVEGSFASYLTVSASQMTLIPERLSYADAATVPMAFLTAWYGLVERANLQPGERVLIHAASGGVGQAAIQIAQAIGAEVIGTASPGKWETLRQQGLSHIMNSRTLDFADEIMQLTDGQGVDVILNSLNGEFIDRSFDVLSPQGRFVEIGKIGIWSHEQVAAYSPRAAYHPFDLGEEMAKDPTLQTRLWEAITTHFLSGALQPLAQTTYPAQEAVAAFRYMQQAKQIGKIVLSFEGSNVLQIESHAVYLVTGGLGALGLHMAQQLVAEGARHLVLTGRQGVTSQEQQAVLDNLDEAGAKITVVQADIAELEDAQKLIAQCAKLGMLRGIVHTAGILDDGVLTAQTTERFEQVMRPKVNGTWNLHTLTQSMDLDFFVCFSSISSLMGSAGQSNYAAANAFMDTLMQQRQQAGLAGLSINWGPWAGSDGLGGMAAELQERIDAQGLTMISPHHGRLLFQYLLNQSALLPQSALQDPAFQNRALGQIGVIPLKRQTQQSSSTREEQRQQIDMSKVLADLPQEERLPRLDAYLQAEIATVLGMSDSTPIDVRTRLFDFGLDSLMAVELKNRLEAGLACKLRSTLLFDYPTLEVLTPYLLFDVLKIVASSEDVDGREEPLEEGSLQDPEKRLASEVETADSGSRVDQEPDSGLDNGLEGEVAIDQLSSEELIDFITKENQSFI
ncbi:MAG: SDR family NAD(P)-dependent oxidoreductase [Chloroflexota bacterium]